MARNDAVPPVAAETAFLCRLCGHCCEGSGGIVVSDADLQRLARQLDMEDTAFAAAWCVQRAGKRFLRSTEDGTTCVFFVRDKGCSVHAAKPSICRAWPYFRGNLVDGESLELAKGYCPGIPAGQTHAAFQQEGLDYLVQEHLIGKGGKDEATALQVADLLSEHPAAGSR